MGVVSDHDELTLEMVTEEERNICGMSMRRIPMRINLGIRRRLATLLNGDQRRPIDEQPAVLAERQPGDLLR
jgi:hypothetical protein